MSSEKHHYVTTRMLKDGLRLESGYRHVLHLTRYRVHLRLHVEPDDGLTEGERFTLVGFRGETREYEQTRTTHDDVDPSEDFWEFVFDDLVPDLSYSLEIDPGGQMPQSDHAADEHESYGEGSASRSERKGRYFCFEKVPWSQIRTVVGAVEDASADE